MVFDSEILFVQKYRPATVEDCILPDRIKTVFREYVKNKEIPHLLLYGNPGSGKSAGSRALCNDIGCDYLFINGSDENGIDTFRNKIKHYASSLSLSGGRKVIIIDEADYLAQNSTQPALRSAMEEFSKNTSFIFTCNYPNKIIAPIHSRCSVVDFTLKNSEKATIAKEFLIRIRNILQTEKIQYDDKVVAEVIKKHFPDFRRVINELQKYSKFGAIDTGILGVLENTSIDKVVQFMKNKDFRSIRSWAASGDYDSSTVFKHLYDELSTFLEPQSIPQAVIIIADYDYKANFVSNKEINLVACLTNLMVELEFKS